MDCAPLKYQFFSFEYNFKLCLLKIIFQAVKSDVEYRTKSGFCIRCIEPMRKWHISFNGFLVPGQACQPNVQKIGEDSELDSTVKRIPASFDLTWTNYGLDLI